MRRLGRIALGALVVVALVAPVGAAPSGPPVRIGGTLALTGPTAPAVLLDKIAGGGSAHRHATEADPAR